ncbi:MAG: trehalose-phosphatase [Thermoleophilia bacterium]
MVGDELREWKELLGPVISRPRGSGVFLDVDGVLAPIMARPELTFVPEEVRRAVRRLVGVYGLVAVVSGRSAADAARLIDLPEVLVVGNHGMESLQEGRHRWLLPEEQLAWVRAARDHLARDGLLRELGVRLEDKTASVALHTRGAPDEGQAWEVALTAAQMTADDNGLVMLPGRRVIDLRPDGIDKGTAVRRLAEDHGLEAAVYVGDDRTDVDAFRALASLQEEGRLSAVRVAVVSDEMPEELEAQADLAIEFAQVGDLLNVLGEAAPAA